MLWRLLNKDRDDRNRITIEVCHSEPGAWKPASFETSDCPQFPKSISYHVGRTMFETDRLPKGWKKKMNRMDEIWVPSEFLKSIFEREGVKNVRVVGESVNTHFFRPIVSVRKDADLPPSQDPENKFNLTRAYIFDTIFERHPLHGYSTTVFLSIFKWEFRKGWDILLNVYFDTFSKNDPVSLFIVTQEYHSDGHSVDDQVQEFIRDHWAHKASSLPHFKIITTFAPQSFLPYFYNFVATSSAHRSLGERCRSSDARRRMGPRGTRSAELRRRRDHNGLWRAAVFHQREQQLSDSRRPIRSILALFWLICRLPSRKGPSGDISWWSPIKRS